MMILRDGGKRSRLVEAAVRRVHQQGFRRTTLADIADEAGVPLGNVYYYFKTKDAIGEALIGWYVRHQQERQHDLDALGDPRARLCGFVDQSVSERDALASYGCPVGTLNAELHKDGGPLAVESARLFAGSLAWLAAQFRELGQGSQSPDHALHLLSALQGASLLAHTFGDPDLVVREARRLNSWIRAL